MRAGPIITKFACDRILKEVFNQTVDDVAAGICPIMETIVVNLLQLLFGFHGRAVSSSGIR
jgi:hypothetical protein